MITYRRYIVAFLVLTGSLLVAAFLLEKDHRKFGYDLAIAGAGFAAAIAAGLTVVDRITKRREQDEWSFVQRAALRQLRSALRTMASTFAVCFIDAGGDVIGFLRASDVAKKFAAFANALHSRPEWTQGLKQNDGDKLLSARADYGSVVKDICSVQFDRLVRSQCDRKIIDAIMTLDDSWRIFDQTLTWWARISPEQKSNTKIEWAPYVAAILAEMARIDDLSQTALRRLEKGLVQ